MPKGKALLNTLILLLLFGAVLFPFRDRIKRKTYRLWNKYVATPPPLPSTAHDCKDKQVLDYFPIPSSRLRHAYRNSIDTIIAWNDGCPPLGPAKIYVRSGFGPGMALLEPTTGEVEVMDVKVAPIKDLDEPTVARMGKIRLDELKTNLLRIVPHPDTDPSIQINQFRIIKRVPRQFLRKLPPKLSFAATVGIGDLEALVNRGSVIIDVRSSEDFNVSHHPKAVNVPYQMMVPNGVVLPTLLEDFSKKDVFTTSALPANKLVPVIFYGENLTDFRPLRAMAISFHSGWKNLSWFRGGEYERIGKTLDTPEKFRDLSLVNFAQAKEWYSSEATFVDVRTAAEYQELRITNSVSAPYGGSGVAEAKSAMQGNLLIEKFSIDALKVAQEIFYVTVLPQDKDRTLIFYGSDEADFRPLKAAIWAKECGWKKVIWFREGLTKWFSRWELDPNAYPTVYSPNN